MIYLPGSINSLTDEFRGRIEELLEEAPYGVASPETLARYVSEEFSKFLVEKDEQDEEEEDKYDDRDNDSESWDARE